jgi:hypothetical protein
MTMKFTAIARRERSLASDRRSGRFARSQVRVRQYEFIRQDWPRLLVVVLASVAAFGLLAFLARNEVERGIIIGIGLATTVGLVMHMVVLFSGSARISMGEAAEK